ncbi:MAG TPA: exodeoxyribonuclease VII small subunit [Desulfobacteraceae bacterium]|nr:exodeoxyribonuclease VII small subunit [Desulfobacteraceae bacterium]
MAEQTFETAMKRLEEIVKNLEEGTLQLEDSLKAFEEGMKLVSLCGRKLDEAEKKVTLLMGQSGGYVQVPFDQQHQFNEEDAT